MQHAARIGDGHLESARSGDADDGEGAEVDSALPRRGHFVRERGLGLGRLGLLALRQLARHAGLRVAPVGQKWPPFQAATG